MNSLEIVKENNKNHGFSGFLKRFDYYRQIPQDISETTYLGAFSNLKIYISLSFLMNYYESLISVFGNNDFFCLF